MSEVEIAREISRSPRRRFGCGCLIFLFILVALGLAFPGTDPPFEFVGHLLAGWFMYLLKVIPQTALNVEMIACSLGALFLGMAGLRWLMRRLVTQREWPWRWSAAWAALLVLLFATSIAAVGVIHQTGWLFRTPHWMAVSGLSPVIRSVNNARQLLILIKSQTPKRLGMLPPSLSDLPTFESKYFFGRADKDALDEPWIYLGAGLHDTDDGNLPVLLSPGISPRGERILGRLDGGVELAKQEQVDKALAHLRQHLADAGENGRK